MSELVDPRRIESIVGVKRHPIEHWARAVSDEEMVYVLHSQTCLDQGGDLRCCDYTLALDRGIDPAAWPQDVAVRVMVQWGRLVPYEGLA